jgi:hypothetical protein
VESNRARVFQSDLKTGKSMTSGGARDTIAEVTSSPS